MRLIIVLLTTAILQVNAAGYAQKISLSEKNAPLEKVFKQIRDQSGYDFIFTNTTLKGAIPVSIEVKNANFEDVLKQLFKNQPLEYVVGENSVVIKQKEPSFLDRIVDDFSVIDVHGVVLDEKGNPLAGATVTIKGTNRAVITNSKGEFSFNNVDENRVLQISFLGYSVKEVKVAKELGSIKMELSEGRLDEVNIVSTGYQNLPKERATGSFEVVDNKLFNRNVGTDVITRLYGITNSMLFSKIAPIQNDNNIGRLSIRGLSAISSNRRPLVVVDNFPYEGDINNINPNDVENITVLKDAAAASIWGTRSGNGVIVITTKSSSYEKPLQISLNSNITVGQKPDLFYYNEISSSDFIDVEKFLFDNGYYDYTLSNSVNPSATTPVVEILDQQKRNLISESEATAQINKFRNLDVRNDFLKYVYRKSTNQQYALNISGGSKQMNYFLSGGYDKNLNNLITSSSDRVSFKANTNFRPIKGLEIQTGILYTENGRYNMSYNNPFSYENRGTSNSALRYPYLRLADELGNPMPIDMVYRSSFTDTLSKGKLLDYKFRPLAEFDKSYNNVKSKDVLINLGIDYKFNPVVSVSSKYQYERTTGDDKLFDGLGSFSTRDQINLFTEFNNNRVINRAIPIGDVVTNTNSGLRSYGLRGQVNVNKTWNNIHELNAIGGAEIREIHNWFQTNRIYGYNDNTLTTIPVDYTHQYPYFNGVFGTAKIPNVDALSDITNRYTSYFANAAYTYNKRYIISLSGRKDASNLFGVKSNNKGQPLWSAGLGWLLHNESFFKLDFISYLKLRASYGYTGNVNNAISAYPIIAYQSTPNSTTGLNYATMKSPPNPNLSWEKARLLNFGIDFSSKNNRISGSIEYFDKRPTNVIAPTVIDPTTGFSTLTVNFADMHGKGVDLNLNSINIQNKNFQWVTNLLFSYNRNKVTRYLGPVQDIVNFIGEGNSAGANISPVQGNEVYGIYTFKWAGLDPKTGDPMGYVNGVASKDYLAITNPQNFDEIDYHGSAVPIYYGAFRNTFTWKSLSLSANFLYKLGYKFQRPDALSYDLLFQNGAGNFGDFAKRWKKEGDELVTNMPSMIYPNNFFRDFFYRSSSVLVEKADHIRLQDVTLSYNFNNQIRYLSNLRLYTTINNLGLLWRANKSGIDPEFGGYPPPPKTIVFGFTANF